MRTKFSQYTSARARTSVILAGKHDSRLVILLRRGESFLFFFIILRSIVGRLNLLSKDKNYNNRANFSSEKSTMKLSRVYIFLKNMEKPKSRPHR